MAIKGAPGNRPTIERAGSRTKTGARLWIVGVDTVKSQLFARLSRGHSMRLGVSVEGGDPAPGPTDDGDPRDNYVFFPFEPAGEQPSDLANAYTFRSFAELEEQVGDHWIHGSVFNLTALARRIAERAPSSLIIFRAVGESQ